MQKASELFIRWLENEGVEYIFGIPGEENIGVMDALLDSSIRFITTRHEQGAAILSLNGDEGIHRLLDIMYAGRPIPTLSRAVRSHPTVAELLPTVLQDLNLWIDSFSRLRVSVDLCHAGTADIVIDCTRWDCVRAQSAPTRKVNDAKQNPFRRHDCDRLGVPDGATARHGTLRIQAGRNQVPRLGQVPLWR